MHAKATLLPPNTLINTNGAGDSFTAGLLVAAMLRHTGLAVSARNAGDKNSDVNDSIISLDPPDPPARNSSPAKKTLTPYTLYMRENYVNLKRQCKDDKRAIFTKCHEMWENESDEVKAMYERMVQEENESKVNNEMSLRVMNDIETLDSNKKSSTADPSQKRNKYMTNRALNLESAVQFAGLVASYHIDMSTRNLPHVDVSRLLEKSMVFPAGLEEI